MPRISPLFAGLMLIVPSVLSIPFYVQEECSCQPISAQASRENITSAECQRLAAELQTNLATFRQVSNAADTWMNNDDIAHGSTHDDEGNPMQGFVTPSQESVLKSAMRSLSDFATGSSSRKPCGQRKNRLRSPSAASVREQLDRRDSPIRDGQEEFRIVCRARVYTSRTRDVIYIDLNPIIVLFIFLSMVLACTTLIEWAVDRWTRYNARIRLGGSERAIYAIPEQEEEQVDVEERVDTEKRAGLAVS